MDQQGTIWSLPQRTWSLGRNSEGLNKRKGFFLIIFQDLHVVCESGLRFELCIIFQPSLRMRLCGPQEVYDMRYSYYKEILILHQAPPKEDTHKYISR